MSHNRNARNAEMAEEKARNAQRLEVKREAVIRGLRSQTPRREIRQRTGCSYQFIEKVAAEEGFGIVASAGWYGGSPA